MNSSYQITILKSKNFKNTNKKLVDHFRSDAPLKAGTKDASNAVNGKHLLVY
jgi:hypothetical protein